jgi:hypothetical protein
MSERIDNYNRRAAICISEQLLVEVMNLPEGTRIVDAKYNKILSTIELVVIHKDLAEVGVGDCVPVVSPSFSRQPPIRFDGWGQKRHIDNA